MKKLLLLVLLPLTAQAADVYTDNEDLKLQLTGRFNFQGGARTNSSFANADKYVSTNRKNMALDSFSYAAAKLTNEHEGLKYGTVLSLSTSTYNDGTPLYDLSHIFTETKIGKIELGSNFDAASVMAISAMNLTASGDDTTSYAANYFPLQTQSGINIPSYPLAFLNNLNQINGESSRKVTYYSPKLGPLQFGISYIPDTGNLGGGSLKDTSDKYNQAIVMTITNAVGQTVTYSEKQPIKDAISTAITFNKDLSSTTNLSIAAVGEFGKAANPGIMTVTNANGTAASTTNYKLASLSTYNVGAQLNVGNYSFVASYVNQGKSMTSFQVFGTNRNSKFYTAGVAYTNDPLGASLTYSKADQYGNKMNIYTAGTSYKLAPGLAPYLEIAYFDGKAGLSAVYNNPLKQKFKATVAVIGIYLAF